MLELNGKKIESIYFNNQKINRYYLNGVMYEFYKPYIDYKWSDTVTRNGLQEIENSGTFELGLSQYFGQGVWFNGVDQELNFDASQPLNNTGSLLFTFRTSSSIKSIYILSNRISNNRLYLNLTNGELRLGLGNNYVVIPFTILANTVYRAVISFQNNNYRFVINENVFEGTHTGIVNEQFFTINNTIKYTRYTDTYIYKDFFIYNRYLSQAEVDGYSNQPNQFFTSALEDNSCILAMPMCEKDGFVRNYKSYSELEKLVDKTNIALTSTLSNARIAQENIGLLIQAGKIYEITYDFLPNVNFVDFKLYIPPTSNNNSQIVIAIPISHFSGKYIFLVPRTYTKTNGSTSCYMWIGVNGTLTTHTFKEISIKEVTGIYPVSNYLSTCRTNAQRLGYGLQTSGFKRDSLGRILSKSNFLEGDGVGFGNTGWIPRADKDWSIELICEHDKSTTGTIGILGTDSTSSNNRFRIYVYYHPASNTRRPHIWIEDQYIAQSTAIKAPDRYLISLTYDSTAKRYRYYLNGIFVDFRDIPNFTNSLPIKIFQYVTYELWKTPLRHVRIHEKNLSQNEVTSNFNAYNKLGLFTESGLPPEPTPTTPQYGIVDEEGNYLVDEDGNFITWE